MSDSAFCVRLITSSLLVFMGLWIHIHTLTCFVNYVIVGEMTDEDKEEIDETGLSV